MEIEENSLRALRGMRGKLKGFHFTIYWRLKRCPFEVDFDMEENSYRDLNELTLESAKN